MTGPQTPVPAWVLSTSEILKDFDPEGIDIDLLFGFKFDLRCAYALRDWCEGGQDREAEHSFWVRSEFS